MDIDGFWAVIDRALVGHEHDEGDDTAHAQTLRRVLNTLSQNDLEDFKGLFGQFLHRADRRDIWGAGYTLDGGMSDDSFLYFRMWLVSRGRAVYESVLIDPDSLADVPGIVPGKYHSAETYAGVADDVYRERFDRPTGRKRRRPG